MKQLLLFLLLSLAAPCIMAFDYPLGNGDNPSIVFNGASGGVHLADALPEGYYSFVTQALQTFSINEKRISAIEALRSSPRSVSI